MHALPPSPPSFGPLGHLRGLRDYPLRFIDEVAREYGDITFLRVGRIKIYLLNRPDLIERMLVTENRRFRKPRLLHMAEETLGQGLLTSEGDFWLRQRRLAAPAFHRARIRQFGETMVDATRRMRDRWGDGGTLDVHAEMMRVTLEIVSETMFGTGLKEETIHEVGEILDVALDRFMQYSSLSFRFIDWFPRPRKIRFRRAIARLDHIVYDIIRERREQNFPPEEDPTLLGMYLSARDEEGKGMSDRQLRDESVTIFLAGHETTANALTFAFYLLSENPEARAKLEEEVDRVLGDRRPTMEDLAALDYTQKVVKEAMRLYPPAWRVGREAIEEVEMDGYRVPKGSQLFAAQWSMQRDPRWYEKPGEFRPERWTEEFERNLPRYAYFPFGGGPRLCIGADFARMEAALVLASVVQRYRLDYTGTGAPELYPSITLRPVNGMPMRVARRVA